MASRNPYEGRVYEYSDWREIARTQSLKPNGSIDRERGSSAAAQGRVSASFLSRSHDYNNPSSRNERSESTRSSVVIQRLSEVYGDLSKPSLLKAKAESLLLSRASLASSYRLT